MAKSLTGILVIALEQAVAAPFCTQRLVEAGARVIKVERKEGDFARKYEDSIQGESAYFVWLNRGKESIAIDIKDPEDRALLQRMVEHADVLVQNLGPGTAQRHGLGSQRLRQVAPHLITCDISGYGANGPRSGSKAYDLLIQAESGLASVTGRPEGPGRVGISICDIAAGLYAYAGIVEALFERKTTGVGQAIEISLFDAIADWMTVPLLLQAFEEKEPPRLGMRHPSIAPYGSFPTGDGEIMLAVQNEREWQRLCADVIGEPTLTNDPRFASNQARVTHREELEIELSRHLRHVASADVLALLEEHQIASATINTVGQVWTHPHLHLGTASTARGEVRMPKPVLISASGPETTDLGTVPTLDEHGPSIRNEFS